MRFGTPAQAPRGRPALTGTPHRLHPLFGQVRVSQKGLLARDHPPGADLPRCVDLKFTVGSCVIWNLDKGAGARSEAWQSGQGGSAPGVLGLQSPPGPALPHHHPFLRSVLNLLGVPHLGFAHKGASRPHPPLGCVSPNSCPGREFPDQLPTPASSTPLPLKMSLLSPVSATEELLGKHFRHL